MNFSCVSIIKEGMQRWLDNYFSVIKAESSESSNLNLRSQRGECNKNCCTRKRFKH